MVVARLLPRRVPVALLVLSLAFAALPVPRAEAQTTHEVRVGRLIRGGDLSRESMRFYPATLRVHQGDVVHFSSESLHGVTLLPLGVSAEDWAAGNAGGIGRPWSLFEPDPDEGAGALKVNLTAMFPSADCGWPTEAPCEFDGRPTETGGILNSGLALVPRDDSAQLHELDFSVTVNADPSEAIEVVDLANPTMTMRIEVVGANDAATTPLEIELEAQKRFQEDVAAADQLHRAYSKKKATKKIKGRAYRMAWAGVETETVSLRGMYPRTITITAGQGVRWSFDRNVFSAYTVTFPAGRAIASARTFPLIACDPDGDAAEGATDTQPVSGEAPYCSSYAELELEVPEPLPLPAGDAKVVSARDVASSGVRGAGIAATKAPYDLLFPKPSPKKGFAYASMLHEISGVRATGKIVVRRPR